MPLQTTPHLNFRGDARPALERYRTVFGGHLVLVTYQDAGNVQDPADADRIMYGQVEAESGFQVMAYDVPAGQPFDRGTASFFVSVRSTDEDEIAAAWEKLSDGEVEDPGDAEGVGEHPVERGTPWART